MTRAERRASQDRRRDQLARLRLVRPLTREERAEEDALEHKLAMRVWHKAQAETEARIAQLQQEMARS